MTDQTPHPADSAAEAVVETPTVTSSMTGPAATPGASTQQRCEEVACSLVNTSFIRNKGVILQFVNNNCTDSASVIGGLRLGFSDVEKLPAYLIKHQDKVKQHAIANLARHMLDCQCPTGALETLSPDDYSMSFTMASLSALGQSLNPSKRNEGPMFYCVYPGLLEATYLGYDGVRADYAHVVNVYIHLLDAGRRRSAIIRKAKQDQKTLEVDTPVAAAVSPKKAKVTFTQVTNRKPFQVPSQSDDLASVKESMSTLVKEVRQLKLPGQYPELATPKRPVQWPPVSTLPELPDDL